MSERGEGYISGAIGSPTTKLTWSEAIGKRVREGSVADLAVSTGDRIAEALDAGQLEVAAQLVDYFMEEAKVCHNVYQVWTEGFERWMVERGVSAEELSAERARLDRVLAAEDGSPFDPGAWWASLGEGAGRIANELRGLAIDADEARGRFDSLRDGWRGLHDRWVDLQAGLLTYIAKRFGEAEIGDCYRAVLLPFLEERYGPYDVRERPYEETIERNLYLALEAMRGHLSGPERMGNLEVTEHDDRWVLAFDPCGSGGRQSRGGGAEDFGFTAEQHDWAWNEVGVCYYCAHCCLTNELWAVERWGAPVRVTDPPLHPEETEGPNPKPCTWTIYKSLEAIPEEAYRRIGRTKPEQVPPGGSGE